VKVYVLKVNKLIHSALLKTEGECAKDLSEAKKQSRITTSSRHEIQCVSKHELINLGPETPTSILSSLLKACSSYAC